MIRMGVFVIRYSDAVRVIRAPLSKVRVSPRQVCVSPRLLGSGFSCRDIRFWIWYLLDSILTQSPRKP